MSPSRQLQSEWKGVRAAGGLDPLVEGVRIRKQFNFRDMVSMESNSLIVGSAFAGYNYGCLHGVRATLVALLQIVRGFFASKKMLIKIRETG